MNDDDWSVEAESFFFFIKGVGYRLMDQIKHQGTSIYPTGEITGQLRGGTFLELLRAVSCFSRSKRHRDVRQQVKHGQLAGRGRCFAKH